MMVGGRDFICTGRVEGRRVRMIVEGSRRRRSFASRPAALRTLIVRSTRVFRIAFVARLLSLCTVG